MKQQNVPKRMRGILRRFPSIDLAVEEATRKPPPLIFTRRCHESDKQVSTCCTTAMNTESWELVDEIDMVPA